MPDRAAPPPGGQPGRCDPWTGRDTGRWGLAALVLTGGLLAVFLAPAVIELLTRPPGPVPVAVTLAAVATLTVLFVRLVMLGDGADRPTPWYPLAGMTAIAVGLASQAVSWVPVLALAALAAGLRAPAAVTSVQAAEDHEGHGMLDLVTGDAAVRAR